MFLSIYLSTYLPIRLSNSPPIYLSIYPSTNLSIYRFTDLSIYLSIYLSICLSIYLPRSLDAFGNGYGWCLHCFQSRSWQSLGCKLRTAWSLRKCLECVVVLDPSGNQTYQLKGINFFAKDLNIDLLKSSVPKPVTVMISTFILRMSIQNCLTISTGSIPQLLPHMRLICFLILPLPSGNLT